MVITIFVRNLDKDVFVGKLSTLKSRGLLVKTVTAMMLWRSFFNKKASRTEASLRTGN